VRGEGKRAPPTQAHIPPHGAPFFSLGITSENVAEKYGIDRATQDGLAVRSHARAAAAPAAGRFKDEIVPVETTIKDPKSGEETRIVVSEDDGIRPGVTAAALSELRTVFKKNGTTTAGNSSQVREGLSKTQRQ
jgi:acetyl-CoA acyltransferase 1